MLTAAAIAVAERGKRAADPELLRLGPQRLCVFASEAEARQPKPILSDSTAKNREPIRYRQAH